MDANEKKNEDDFLLSFSDLVQLCRKNKYKIYYGALFFAFLGCLYTLSKPIEYQVAATFREKGKSQVAVNSTLKASLFLGGDSSDNEAIAIMKSRKLMEKLVIETGMQAVIVAKENRFGMLPLQNVKKNLIVEYAAFKNKLSIPLPDILPDFVAEKITFNGEVPRNLQIVFRSNEDFDVREGNKTLGTGKLAVPFFSNNFGFTLLSNSNAPLAGKDYSLTLMPLSMTAENLTKKFNIENDRFDKGLLKLSYKHPDRHQAANHLNTLMIIYLEYLDKERQRLLGSQISYLEKRQDEMNTQLQERMNSYARTSSSDIFTTGYADALKAMDFLATYQHSNKQQLLAIDLEIKRFQSLQNGDEIYFNKILSPNNPPAIQAVFNEICQLKQEADALDLALRNTTPKDPLAIQESFIQQLNELNEVQQNSKEAKMILASLDHDDLPIPSKKLLDNPKFMIKTWYEKLIIPQNKNIDDQIGAKDEEEWKSCKASFAVYLSNLIHLLAVHQRSIEEHLVHQQAPLEEFQGVNLNTAKELYLTYSKELSGIQSKMIQQEYIIGQIDEPGFEISSLSTVLTDPISTEMLSKASAINLSLRDHDNRSNKEQERLKTELAIQKGFLTSHLKHSVQLLKLQQKLLQDKIQALQNSTLTLIQERISILQKHLAEYVSFQLTNLLQEKNFIEQNLLELRKELSYLPHKWVSEKLIDQQLELNIKMTEELTKLVESKNISNNLEMIQSAPIDIAVVPTHPKSPRLLLFAVLGAMLGGLFTIAFVLLTSIIGGIKASTDNLSLADLHVSGTLSKSYRETSSEPLLDKDLDTLRRIIAFLDLANAPSSDSPSEGHSLLLIKGHGPDYSASLAKLMSKKGLKILLLPLSFNTQEDPQYLPGLLQCLERETEEPKINKAKGYDFISSGGITRFSNELIGSHRFHEILQKLMRQYDWVIAVSHALPHSAEAESLMERFHYAAISISDETIDQLKGCIRIAKSQEKPKKTTFVITHPLIEGYENL
jgi:tyrosine-protein kinase Etk/Wzc